ncbi:MAG: hypothetical protein ACR2HR_10330 [Euzebya sp.]
MPVRNGGNTPLRSLSCLLLAGLLVGACTGGTQSATDSASAVPTDPNALYEGFVDCEPSPESIEFQPIEGLVMPDGLVVTNVSEAGPLVQVTGFIDQTPVDIRDLYAEDAQLVYLEDEGFEAEILIDSGDFRTFLKASIRCRTGSVMSLIRAPDDDAGALPVPGQQAGGP